MGIGTAAAVIAPVVGGVTNSVIGSNAAKSAAQTQAESAQKALDFQEQEWNTQQKNEQPFLDAGTQGVNTLASMLATPGQGLLQQYGQTFQAPTLEQAEKIPGYQFQLEQGTNAINQNAAANGSLLSGNTGKALTDYGQGLASTSYGNLYNQALQQYMTNYGVWNQGQTNTYDRLAGLSGIGATAAANLGQQGQAAATNTGNLNMQQGTALASGKVGSANAIMGGINSVTSGISQLPLYSMLGQQANQSSYGDDW